LVVVVEAVTVVAPIQPLNSPLVAVAAVSSSFVEHLSLELESSRPLVKTAWGRAMMEAVAVALAAPSWFV